MKKIARTFRLDASDIKLLDEIALERGCTQADAIRFAIRSGADVLHIDSGGAAVDGGGAAVSEAIAALTAQLAAKDEQIATLGEALRAAQGTAQAAQVLHAQELAALESTEQKRRRWRWPWSRGE